MHQLAMVICEAISQLHLQHGVRAQSVRIDGAEWTLGDWRVPREVDAASRDAWLINALKDAPREIKRGETALGRRVTQASCLALAREIAEYLEATDEAKYYIEIARWLGTTPTSHEIGVTQYDSAGEITRWGDVGADAHELHCIKIFRQNIVAYEAYPDKPPVLTDAGDGTLKFTDPDEHE